MSCQISYFWSTECMGRLDIKISETPNLGVKFYMKYDFSIFHPETSILIISLILQLIYRLI